MFPSALPARAIHRRPPPDQTDIKFYSTTCGPPQEENMQYVVFFLYFQENNIFPVSSKNIHFSGPFSCRKN
jgi:hypothetical protein